MSGIQRVDRLTFKSIANENSNKKNCDIAIDLHINITCFEISMFRLLQNTKYFFDKMKQMLKVPYFCLLCQNCVRGCSLSVMAAE